MRVIQLGFQLHAPYDEEKFRKANEEVYQPFFALLERNTQKHSDFHFSLIISGAWLEQAEKYESGLIERLKKLVQMGRVELVSVPYYYSLAFFYAQDELAEQVRQYQDQLERLFGVTGRIFALPELMYNDAIGKWAEGFGFAGMLVGGSLRALDWRSPNRVYEAAGCEYLRLLVRNSWLSEMVERGDEKLLVEKKDDAGEAKQVLSVEKLRKLLDLEFLRGNLVNLYFDTGMFARLREKGVSKFFDDLIALWLDGENNRFATAAEACVVETPTVELTVKETVSWRGDAEKGGEPQAEGLVLKAEVENKLPEWLGRREQRAVSELVYGARRQILASEDEKLVADFRKLTLIDYHKEGVLEGLKEKVEELKHRAEEIKKTQAVEISRAYTKKRDRGDVERKMEVKEAEASDTVKVVIGGSGAVKVNFGKRTGTGSGAVHGAVGANVKKDNSADVPVRRLGKARELGEVVDVARVEDVEVVDDTAAIVDEMTKEAEESDVVVEREKTKPKKHAVRKIIKKLVIE